jgi:hemerythrin
MGFRALTYVKSRIVSQGHFYDHWTSCPQLPSWERAAARGRSNRKRAMSVHRITRTLIGPNHALGHAEIDSDHFAIADYWLQLAKCPPIAIPFHVARLRKRMRSHFSHEVALIEAAGRRLWHDHQDEHDAMLRLCDQAYELCVHNARAARALLRNRLPRMMRSHIICMDQIAVLMIKDAAEDRPAPYAPH